MKKITYLNNTELFKLLEIELDIGLKLLKLKCRSTIMKVLIIKTEEYKFTELCIYIFNEDRITKRQKYLI